MGARADALRMITPTTLIPIRRRAFVPALIAVGLLVAACQPPIPPPDDGEATNPVATLLVSAERDRTPSEFLAGTTLSGKVYIHAEPAANASPVTAVEFRLDDPTLSRAPRQSERTAPYDFAGGSVSTGNSFDVTPLPSGTHVVSVTVKRADGTRQTRSASFNRGTAPASTTTSAPPATLPATTVPPATLPPTTLPPVTLPPTTLPPSPPTGVDAVRPYAADSPWNTPIPASPRLHPQSASYVQRIASAGYFGSNPDQYSYPVHLVDSSTPMRTVRLTGYFSDVYSEDARTNLRAPTLQVPVPAVAASSPGSDGSIIFWDPVTGAEWGFWRFWPNSDGSFTATNGYRYNTNWSGVPPKNPSSTSSLFISRGAGVPYLTGLVRRWEMDRGRIDHALAFAYNFPAPSHVYPATKSDGTGDPVLDVPEGARLQLDPSLTEADFDRWGLDREARVLARAMQEYGMYVIDRSGHPKIMIEDSRTAGWNGSVNDDTVAGIPLSAFRVIDWTTTG
jgi:hypothetical protein